MYMSLALAPYSCTPMICGPMRKLCIGMTCKASAGTFTRKLKCKSMDVHHTRTLCRGTHARYLNVSTSNAHSPLSSSTHSAASNLKYPFCWICLGKGDGSTFSRRRRRRRVGSSAALVLPQSVGHYVPMQKPQTPTDSRRPCRTDSDTKTTRFKAGVQTVRQHRTFTVLALRSSWAAGCLLLRHTITSSCSYACMRE